MSKEKKMKQMGKRIGGAVWLVSAVILAAAACSVHAAEELKVLRAQRTKTPPTIDGRLNEPAWAQAEKAVGFSNYNQPKIATADQTIGRVLFDDEFDGKAGFERRPLNRSNGTQRQRQVDRRRHHPRVTIVRASVDLESVLERPELPAFALPELASDLMPSSRSPRWTLRPPTVACCFA